MKLLTVKDTFAGKLKKGFPLIEKDALSGSSAHLTEGDLFDVTSEKGEFIGKGYYGLQNKGVGWVLSRARDERIDGRFFLDKLKKRLKQEPICLTRPIRRRSGFSTVRATASAASRLTFMTVIC